MALRIESDEDEAGWSLMPIEYLVAIFDFDACNEHYVWVLFSGHCKYNTTISNVRPKESWNYAILR